MGKKNIYFSILNYDLSSRVYLPYTYGVLRAYCESIAQLKENYEWHEPFYRLNTKPIEEMVDSIENPHILTLSCNMWNMQKQLKMGYLVKKKFPNALIILGGPEAPRKPEGFFQTYPFIDIIVRAGEGEIPLSHILLEYLQGENCDLSRVSGIIYRKKDQVIYTGPGEKLNDLSILPSPYLMGYLDFAVKELHRDKQKISTVIETNRGCPYSCTFCDWGSDTMSKIRRFSDDKVLAEIEWIQKNKINEVMIADANFGIFKRDLQFSKKFVSCNKDSSFPRNIHVAFAKNTNKNVIEIATLLSENRMCYGATLSVQSMNQAVLDSVHRRNIKLQNYKDLIFEFNRRNIPIYSDVILGLPNETKDSFASGVGELLELGIHTGITLHPLSILENSPMNTPDYLKKYNIQTVQRPFWPSFPLEKDDFTDVANIVVSTSTMPPNDWLWSRVFIDMIQAFHIGGWTRFLSIYLSDKSLISYKDFYSNLLDYSLKNKNSFLGKILNKTYQLYVNFLSEPSMQDELWRNFEVQYGEESYTFHGMPFHEMWINIAANRSTFFSEIREYISITLEIEIPEGLFSQLLQFQDCLVYSPDYNPEEKKKKSFQYNFFDYFYKGNDIKKINNTLIFHDTHTGLGDANKLNTDSFESYIKTAMGFKVRHAYYYVHQPDKCEVRYDT